MTFSGSRALYEEVTSAALTRVLAWQLKEEMQRLGISKVEMAERMGTSRSQLDRLLESANSGVSIDTVFRAAKALNRESIFSSFSPVFSPPLSFEEAS